VQLSFLYNQLGLALKKAAQYDKALEYYRKALAIDLKQLGPGHPSVATSYNNMALVYYAKKDIAKAKEYMGKSLRHLPQKAWPESSGHKILQGRSRFLKQIIFTPTRHRQTTPQTERKIECLT
jgi:tetratricopeptide (TPR) repeat protein